jgi:hypothetical protein
MKNLTFTIITVLSTGLFSYGQQTPIIEKRAQNIFVEFLGQGLLVTANYDTRFTNKRNGIGGRIGIGYINDSVNGITTIPVGINYLLGKKSSFFEIGLGATYFGTNRGRKTIFENSEENSFIGTMSFSYRLQPVDSGFSFRGGITPIFNSKFFLPYYVGVSLGYTF